MSTAASSPSFETADEKDVDVPMRDGTVLRANITRPDAPGPFPALVERTPYSKEAGSEVAVNSPEFFARRGYAVVIQDVRGRFASEGDFYPFRDDGAGVLRDGYDTIEWTAAQPWCDGKVGMIGGSYSGATQYRAALSRPPHLQAQFVRESSADYYREWVYRGGAHEHGFSLHWARLVTDQNLAQLVSGEELVKQQGLLDHVKADIDDWYERLPLYPCRFLTGLSDWHNDFLAHPEDGPYWWELAVDRCHDQIETPIYHLGGWFDIFLAGTLKNYTGLRRRARTEAARRAQKLIIGPWVHGPSAVNASKAGDVDFGPEAARDLNELRLPWFDHWLKGAHNGILDEPPVRLFVMGRNEWRDEADWPLPDPAPAETPVAEAPQPEHRSIEAPVDLAEAPEGSGSWLAAPIRALQSDSWSGHIRFGINVERGNSELTDFTFAVELDREFQEGWQLDSQFEYFFSENAVATTRDNWLAEARVSRELDSGLGYYAGGSYERDEIGLYQASAFVTAGGIWHPIAGDKADWQLRAGAGQRYREPALGGETQTDWVGEVGSSFSYAFSDTVEFASETTGFLGGGSRVDQRFRLTSRLFGDWALQTGLRIEHEFEDRPGFEPTDTRLDISLLYGF